MTKYLDMKDITNIVKTEMLNFTKTFIPQMEKSVLLFERVDKLESKVNSINEKLEKLRKAVSNLQPLFETMESSVRYMKEQFEGQDHMESIKIFIDEAVDSQMLRVANEIKSKLDKDMAKDGKFKDFKTNLKKLDKRLNSLETEFGSLGSQFNDKLAKETEEIKQYVGKETSKSTLKASKLKDFKNEISTNLRELVKFIGDNYVSLNTYVNMTKENEQARLALQDNMDSMNTTLGEKIASLCQVVKESLDGKMKQSLKDQMRESAVEAKIDKISHVR